MISAHGESSWWDHTTEVLNGLGAFLLIALFLVVLGSVVLGVRAWRSREVE